jgi:hypothetical protein
VLREAIDDLLRRDGTGGPGAKATDRRPHLAAAIVADQGGPCPALIDPELGFPGAMILMTIGRVPRPVLAPLALRTTPLPKARRSSS